MLEISNFWVQDTALSFKNLPSIRRIFARPGAAIACETLER